MAAQVGRPHAVQVVLLVDVGEEARRHHEVGEGGAGRLQRLLEVLHAQHGLLAHGRRQVEVLVPVRVVMVDGAAVTPDRKTSAPRRTTMAGAYGIITSFRRSA